MSLETAVTIAGTGLAPNPSVEIPGIDVLIRSATETCIRAVLVIPASSSGGIRELAVAASGLTSNRVEFFVQTPTSARYIRTTRQGINPACRRGFAGWRREVIWQLCDQLGEPVRRAGIVMSDRIQIGTPNGLGLARVITGRTRTDSEGRWRDYYAVCSTACPESQTESRCMQTWFANSKPLEQPVTVRYCCGRIELDGH